jgi:hypothetical protein
VKRKKRGEEGREKKRGGFFRIPTPFLEVKRPRGPLAVGDALEFLSAVFL